MAFLLYGVTERDVYYLGVTQLKISLPLPRVGLCGLRSPLDSGVHAQSNFGQRGLVSSDSEAILNSLLPHVDLIQYAVNLSAAQQGTLRALAIVLALGAAVACSREPRAEQPATSPDSATLVRRLRADVTTLNPVHAADAGERYLAKYLFTPLIYLDAQGQPTPGLATWEISNDKRHYRFRLNPKATFSDGRPVRASDVRFTLDKIKNADTQSHIADSLQFLDSVQVVDSITIDVVFQRALATQLIRFADVYVLPEHHYATTNSRHTTPLGSGPYILVRRDPGKQIVLRRRDDYWREPPPIRTVIFDIITDDKQAWNALVRGMIDETTLTSDAWQHERTNPRWKDHFEFRMFYAPTYSVIAWNGHHPFLQEKRVRRALGMTVPVEAMISRLYHGTARPISGPFTPDDDAYNHSVPPLPYAPQQAARDLAAAGFRDDNNDGILERDGRALTITLQIMPGDSSRRFAELLQAECARIGVRIEISVVDVAQAITRIREGNFDAAYLAWELDTDPDLFSKFHSSQHPPHGSNFAFYANPTADRLIEAARLEFDTAKRQELNHRLHAILAEDQPYTWTIQPALKWAVNQRVQYVHAKQAGIFLWYPGELAWKIRTSK